jgi:Flp pilus assembly protein TadB
MMLSDAEQRQLTAIESQLRQDDPAFVERFTGRWDRRRHGQWRGLAALAALVVAVAAAVVGLMLTSVPTVVIAVTAVGSTVGLWITDRRRSPV